MRKKACEMGKQCYRFRGGIYRFGNYVGDFRGETFAATEAKARSNLTWQAKQAMGLAPNVPIRLVGTISAQAAG